MPSLREIFRKIEKTYFFSINVRILYGKKVRFGHGRKSKRVMKKRSWGLQVDPNINLLSKKNRYLRSKRFFAKMKKPIFPYKFNTGKGSDSAIVEKARYEKALLGSSSRLKYKPFKQKKIDTFAPKDFSQN